MTILSQRTPNPIVYCDFHLEPEDIVEGTEEELAADVVGYADRALENVAPLADHEVAIADLITSALADEELDQFVLLEVEAVWSMAQVDRIEVRVTYGEHTTVAWAPSE